MKIFKLSILAFVLVLASCKTSEYPNLEDGVYADIETSKGNIVLKLNYEEVPLTVANFVSLAEGTNTKVADSLKGKKFYDGLMFHRVMKDFMIQGGDPLGSGLGDPGYKFADEFPKDENGKLKLRHDKAGVLSMANSGKDSNGSQFFITHKETPWLDGVHSVFGQVQTGQEVVDSISKGDVMNKVEIIRVGKQAEKFDAAKVFVTEIKRLEEEEKVRLAKFETDSEVFSKKMNEAEAEIFESGLKILITEKGKGRKPKSGETVQVHYRGYLADGTMFDSSYKKNKPISFTIDVDRVVAGWTEGIPMLTEGSKAILFIPYYLGFGERGRQPLIPAKADLIFEVDLVKVGK